MFTVTGQIQDATGAALHATIDFVSQSTPLAGSGVITTNTDDRILSDPSDGTFSVGLMPGNYRVTIAANGQGTTFNIAVPTGSGTATIDTLVTTPLVYPYIAPNVIWNGQWAGSITFMPMSAPPTPTYTEVNYTGGNIDSGIAKYSYWVSYVTATGETTVSPQLVAQDSSTGSPVANRALRITFGTAPSGVTAVHVWRTYVDNGHTYGGPFPIHIGLLATVSPLAAYYDDWESTAQFAARVTAQTPPIFNTTAGQLLSSNGTPCVYITDGAVYFPGTNTRIKLGLGPQIFNFDTQLWHTLICTANPAQLGVDAGNPT